MAVSATSSSTSTTAAASSLASASDAGSQDRFLKLLVTQLQNQDPLSPMDNAELTSQIAQINTVTGIANLNTSVQALSGQFLQMQTLQGASLIGKDVIVPGNKLDIADGVGQGGFELAAAADSVKVEVLNAAGTVVDTVQLGACNSGVNGFNWVSGKYDNSSGLTFRVTATSGATKLDATLLMRDTVNAVSTSGNSLTLELDRSGSTPYSSVKAIN
ncbi:MAG TPA: flagellar hook capping FlgD N-terminal domain-containing protein [Burkholderiaceae bacterium]|nr:flagellar hook capping FlgD N-terminal domain-containing protein [Burkholderiaceae bacterium]